MDKDVRKELLQGEHLNEVLEEQMGRRMDNENSLPTLGHSRHDELEDLSSDIVNDKARSVVNKTGSETMPSGIPKNSPRLRVVHESIDKASKHGNKKPLDVK